MRQRGFASECLGVDEEPEDLNARLVQMSGYTIAQCELRDPHQLEEMAKTIADTQIRFYDATHTIEAAAADLADWAKESGRKAVFILDSIQTVRCVDSLNAKGPRELVEANVRAFRAVTSKHRLLSIATSEANRGSYRDEDAAANTNDLAAGKESGSIEFCAQALIMARTPKGYADVVQVRVPKNRRGARSGFEFFLKLDRDRHDLTDCPDPGAEPGAVQQRDHEKRSANKRAIDRDAREVLRIIAADPGIGTRSLRASVKLAGLKLGVDSLNAVLLRLEQTNRIQNGPTLKGERQDPHYFALAPSEGEE